MAFEISPNQKAFYDQLTYIFINYSSLSQVTALLLNSESFLYFYHELTSPKPEKFRQFCGFCKAYYHVSQKYKMYIDVVNNSVHILFPWHIDFQWAIQCKHVTLCRCLKRPQVVLAGLPTATWALIRIYYSIFFVYLFLSLKFLL